uniref:Uncharacterized protein n=1 Tax=Eutreptiella gymnastica TaxID=73025 RepID=A0A7S1J1A4_9EUGL|mmetsp:Transcript_58854/g.104942  ORF Transcript_58854/g.104942 Transcript_58854/m.104942 type:complete len:137 (+) Transcript_58854:129-539(+)
MAGGIYSSGGDIPGAPATTPPMDQTTSPMVPTSPPAVATPPTQLGGSYNRCGVFVGNVILSHLHFWLLFHPAPPARTPASRSPQPRTHQATEKIPKNQTQHHKLVGPLFTYADPPHPPFPERGKRKKNKKKGGAME